MGDKSVECWWEPDKCGGWTVDAGAVQLEVSLGPVGEVSWSVCWHGEQGINGASRSAESAKRAAIEAARRVLRESWAMLDALEGK